MEQEIKLLKKYNIALKNAYIKEREEKDSLSIGLDRLFLF